VYNTTDYVDANIKEVEHTLVESFVLVMIVVFVFLQGFRATAIPMIAIPVSLIATFAMMAAFGFSINTLTMCGLVLAIGLVVDDAIIVVENIEKFLERGMRPLEATRAAMAEITAPIVTIGLVLGAVFVPVAFIPGLTGNLYRQFALTIVFSFLFSAINSLTFSPAMARLFLRPRHGESAFFLFRWFNRGMRWLEDSYDAFLDFTAHHWWTIVIPSLALLAWTALMLVERPKAFIPTEDQGYLIVAIQTPDGTGRGPTSRIAHQVSDVTLKTEGVSDVVLLDGLNVLSSTNQSNAATAFVILKEWSERRRVELRAQALARTIQDELRKSVSGAVVLVIQPPPIRGLSQTGGFEFMLEDRDGKGVEALAMVADRFLEAARKRPELAGVFTPFSARVPQLRFLLDRTKAQRLDVAVSDVFAALQAYLGGLYVNDFNLYGKVWKVFIQAEGSRRAVPNDIRGLYVLNHKGQKVPLSSLGDVTYTLAPIDVPHYNLYNAAKITGQPAPATARARPSAPWRRSPERRSPRASPPSGPGPPSRSSGPATSPP
jgi:hydrophobe/amphiphile efflux-1 (HAE1) family protein